MEGVWNKGWDNESDGQVQFVSFYDDGGSAVGSTGRMLKEITLDSNTLMAVSIILMPSFLPFLFSFDAVESRVFLTMIGVGLVVSLPSFRPYFSFRSMPLNLVFSLR